MPGQMLTFGNGGLAATVVAELPDGERMVEFDVADIQPLLERIGELPLPPYIVQRRRELRIQSETTERGCVFSQDNERYQTVYARAPGSIAAPTAGLHFSNKLLAEIAGKGVHVCPVTLHVGAGTFKPVEVANPAEHAMHREHYHICPLTAAAVNAAKSEGRRIIAVGTTAVRTLESSAEKNGGIVAAGLESTRLLILPGYRFQLVSAMVTNFHLPRSTLLMLVSAFGGQELVRRAYAAAIQQRYQFYSYGDAMLVS